MDVRKGDNVLITAPAVANVLVVSQYETIGERGAHPRTRVSCSAATRAYLYAMDTANFEPPDHQLAAVEAADAVIRIGGSINTYETNDSEPAIHTAFGASRRPIRNASLDCR